MKLVWYDASFWEKKKTIEKTSCVEKIQNPSIDYMKVLSFHFVQIQWGYIHIDDLVQDHSISIVNP